MKYVDTMLGPAGQLLYKFGLRLDSPGCLKVKDQKLDIEQLEINLESKCPQYSSIFKLHIDLYDSIDKLKSSWK